MRRAPRVAWATPAFAIALLLASCTSNAPNPPPSPGGSGGASASPSPTPPPGPFASVTEADFQFTPARIVIGANQDLRITNAGPSLHNLSVAATQVDLDTTPAQTTRTESIGGALKPGTYPFFCKYHRGRGMVGVIIVVAS